MTPLDSLGSRHSPWQNLTLYCQKHTKLLFWTGERPGSVDSNLLTLPRNKSCESAEVYHAIESTRWVQGCAAMGAPRIDPDRRSPNSHFVYPVRPRRREHSKFHFWLPQQVLRRKNRARPGRNCVPLL